jgi:hypothetical protein
MKVKNESTGELFRHPRKLKKQMKKNAALWMGCKVKLIKFNSPYYWDLPF